jgi:hypothetical protein
MPAAARRYRSSGVSARRRITRLRHSRIVVAVISKMTASETPITIVVAPMSEG